MMIKYIGIGASAGGLKVLEEFVSNLPIKSHSIYIIAQHLDKNKKSSLAEILSRYTTLEVLEIDNACNFSPNRIYILPPKYNLILKNNHLELSEIKSDKQISTPSIDTLLESLAMYKKKDAIGIVLTGSGNDGTIGLKKIQENGGITIVQEPEEAEHKSMPQSAIDFLDIDLVLPIKNIAKYLHNPIYKEKNLDASQNSLKKIIKLLNKKENLNIDKYKEETIIRRIQKRMLLIHSDSLEEYIDYIHSNPKELYELKQDLLIGVTEFFRDSEAFETLEIYLDSYLKDKPQHYELRIWSVGCSSGEEVYSLAILIAKISKKLNKMFDIHIFATDINNISLEKARKGFYSKESLKNIDKNLIDEYFVKVDNGYKVIQQLRQQIVFTNHNILNDPPFINQDIIICRNVLIYILPNIQKEILTLFHHSLKEDGLFFLGSSESTMLIPEYFTTQNSEHKIYKKEKLNNPPKISTHYFSKHLDTNDNTPQEGIQKVSNNIEDKLSSTIFDFFIPNCIVVNKQLSIVYKKGELPFLKLADGFITLNIIDNLHEDLRYDVRSLLKNSFQTNTIQTTKFIEIQLSSSEKIFVRVISYPFDDIHINSMRLLYFQQLDAEELQFSTHQLQLPDESFIIKNLSSQLSDTKNELYALSDELTINKENTQALSEELQSTNEELQSSNEELETSNEELQSSNEELQSSILDTQRLKEKLSLILNSSQDAIIGLDLEGNHTFANAAALNMLGYTLDELIGKSGHHLWHHTYSNGEHYPIEKCPIHHHLSDGASSRNEDVFFKKNGLAIEVEVLQNPIIKDSKLIGKVLSFHDITEKNRLKRASEAEHELADLYLNISGNIVMKLDLDGNIQMINHQGAKLLKSSKSELIGKNWFNNFIPIKNIAEVKSFFTRIKEKKTPSISNYKNIIIDTQKQEHLIAWTNGFIKDANENIIGILSSGNDITQEKKLSKKILEQEHLYKLTFEEADIGIAHVSIDGKWIDTNTYLSKLLGYSKKEFRKTSIQNITHKDDMSYDESMIKELLENKRNSYNCEKRYIHKNGKIVWVNLNVVILKDEFNNPIYLLKIIRDISEIKMLMYQLEIEKNELNRIIQFTPIPLMIHNKDGEILLVNRAFESNSGYTLKELSSMDILIEMLYKGLDNDSKNKFKSDYENVNNNSSIEHIITTKSNEKHTWLLKSAALHGNIDKKEAFISSAIDITTIKDKDNIMIAQSRQAAMGDMLAMVSHQWRQPLSVISMTTNILRAQQELEEEISEDDITQLINTINEQTQYLSHTIDDFRNFFKPDKIKEKMMLSTIFTKLKTLIQKSLENNNISLIFEDFKDFEIVIYSNQLIQIMLNLINNAKDAIKEKTLLNGFIKVSVEKHNDKFTIGVCDNGGGIDESIRDTISQPYVSTKSKNGTGLGLYMSTVIVQKHLNGKIDWTSNKQGSCFYISLPIDNK